jgi:hypothetical protein
MTGWSEAGTSLTTGDSVGIGTTTPQSALHTVGVVTVQPGTGPDARVELGASLIKSATDALPPDPAGPRPGPVGPRILPGSKLSLATYPAGPPIASPPGGGGPPHKDPIDRLVIDSAGRVGIGATTPVALLDVGGQASFQGAVSLNKAGVSGVQQETRAGLTFGASDSPGAYFLGTSDASATAVNATLGLYSYQFKDFLQYWAPNGNVGLGTATPATKLHVVGDVTVTGDVLLTGADCAENFEVGASALEAGSVVVIDEAGVLRESTEPYDRKVAGVVSGAGSYRPALLLDSAPSIEARAPVALVGKVFCKVDATTAPVNVGDLLTTAARAGHAMKASDPGRAFGAVIGKALRALPGGVGLIPILVALQ